MTLWVVIGPVSLATMMATACPEGRDWSGCSWELAACPGRASQAAAHRKGYEGILKARAT